MIDLLRSELRLALARRLSEQVEHSLANLFDLSGGPAKTLTIDALRASLTDLDPDGRLLQEGMLIAECQHLTVPQVRTLTFLAKKMQNWSLPDTELATDEIPLHG